MDLKQWQQKWLTEYQWSPSISFDLKRWANELIEAKDYEALKELQKEYPGSEYLKKLLTITPIC